MDKETLKSLVKQYFNLTEKSQEQTFASVVLADGTEVTNEKEGELAVGDTLYVVTTEGNVVAPSGEHTTAEGFVIFVDEQGAITEIKEGEQAPEEQEMSSEEEEGTQEEMAEEQVQEMSVEEAVIEAIAEIVLPQIEEMKTKLASMEEKMNEVFSNTPASESATDRNFSADQTEVGSVTTIKDIKRKRYSQILNK